MTAVARTTPVRFIDAPFARAADEFLAERTAHFSVPGHKRNPLLVGDDPLLLADMPHLCGVDDMRLSRDLLGRAERLAAQAWGAAHTLFTVSGSTHPNQAVCLAAGSPGDEVIVARTSHRSVYAGLVFAGLEPVWISPDVDPVTGLALGMPVERVERALVEHPRAKAVMLVEPSYLGLTSDIPAIVEAAHAHGVPLVCDQAWGAHFAFHPGLPDCAVSLGADAVIMSAHKTLTAFSQGAMLHVSDRGLLDVDRTRACFEALLTTSASGAIYASLDRARALMEERGTVLVEHALRLADGFREEVGGWCGARCHDAGMIAYPSVGGVDPLKLVVDLSATGADGFQIERDLRDDGVVLEFADRTTLVPLLTIGDDERSVARLTSSLKRSLARWAGTATADRKATSSWRITPQPVLTLRDAFFAPRQRVSWRRAVGRVAAEIVSPYPPGIPALAPGELITSGLLNVLRGEVSDGTRMAGPSDPSLETLVVVAESSAPEGSN
ncbi:MAG: aminotransferase class V-fold PLP-dependent enzyme [Acidimicrobiia bacterium]|nr:aminotransferase class V-fold PLP-dependent enzyme [Acidimicrobiia bacterium]